jgi:hypothetical protein
MDVVTAAGEENVTGLGYLIGSVPANPSTQG